MALETDYTSAAYNSYVTEAEADAIALRYSVYWPDIDWVSLTPEQKEAWLLNVCMELNSQWKWEGALNSRVVSVESGGMQWPRTGADHANGADVGETEVPQAIKDFQVVRAFEYMSDTSLIHKVVGKGAIKRQKLDVLEQEFFEPSSEKGDPSRSDYLSYKLIEPYLTTLSKVGGTVALVRA